MLTEPLDESGLTRRMHEHEVRSVEHAIEVERLRAVALATQARIGRTRAIERLETTL